MLYRLLLLSVVISMVMAIDVQCVLYGDSHYNAWMGATANLHLPCKFRMARIQTRLISGVPGLSYCFFEVFGYNEIVDSKVQVSGMEISLAIGDLANQYYQQLDVIKYDINGTQVQAFNGSTTKWATGKNVTYPNITIASDFDDELNFSILNIPHCGFRAKFRPDDPGQKMQKMVPSMSIVTAGDSFFGQTEQARPSFAGEVLQNKEMCQVLVDDFFDCPVKEKAIGICGRILNRRKSRQCLGLEALRAFWGCVRAVCGEKAVGCAVYNQVMNITGCEKQRKPKKECKQ